MVYISVFLFYLSLEKRKGKGVTYSRINTHVPELALAGERAVRRPRGQHDHVAGGDFETESAGDSDGLPVAGAAAGAAGTTAVGRGRRRGKGKRCCRCRCFRFRSSPARRRYGLVPHHTHHHLEHLRRHSPAPAPGVCGGGM